MAQYFLSRDNAGMDMIRELIGNAGATFIHVTSTKKDGSEMKRVYQQAATVTHMTEPKSASTAQAVITRKVNNPHLMNVYDVNAGGIRCFNLASVTRIAMKGDEFIIRD